MLTALLVAYGVFVSVLAVKLYYRSRVESTYSSVGWFHRTGTIGVVRTWPMCEECELVYRRSQPRVPEQTTKGRHASETGTP